MSSTIELLILIVAAAVVVSLFIYASKLIKVYNLGRIHIIEKKSKTIEYYGVSCWVYRKGRQDEYAKRGGVGRDEVGWAGKNGWVPPHIKEKFDNFTRKVLNK